MKSFLCYFLVDDGDKEGGMFLAAAYENFIQWQNQFIDDIISKNSLKGILNSYISQLEMEINAQDAVESDIINIDENIYEKLNHLMTSYSMRNIFNINEKNIYYRNYNDIIYDYDLIEEELAKLILPGIKKFKKDKIRFITYLYEGFRGAENSSILVRYDEKYGVKELSEEEKHYIDNIIKKINNNKKIYNNIFSSLQILMNEILKENFQPNDLIINVIKKLSKYLMLNEELINLLNDYSFSHKDGFTVNSLISLFEYFEFLCWEDIKKFIPKDFQIPVNEKVATEISQIIENDKDKLIDLNSLTNAIRKLISRNIVGTRQDVDIRPEADLKLFITKSELWPKIVMEDDRFLDKIDFIFKAPISVGQSLQLYDLLNGDAMHFKKEKKKIEQIGIEKEKEKEENKNKNNLNFSELQSIQSEKEEEKSNYKNDEIINSFNDFDSNEIITGENNGTKISKIIQNSDSENESSNKGETKKRRRKKKELIFQDVSKEKGNEFKITNNNIKENSILILKNNKEKSKNNNPINSKDNEQQFTSERLVDSNRKTKRKDLPNDIEKIEEKKDKCNCDKCEIV